MRIVIKQRDKWPLRLVLPTRLLTSRPVVNLLFRLTGPFESGLTAEQLYRFLQVAERYRRTNRGWQLLEVESADGDFVSVKL